MDPRITGLLARQSGVVGRAQALAAGLKPHDLRRLVRRRELTRVHAGVYVDHTGPLSWRQRTWAAVLALAPAALSHRSALGPHDGPIHVAVDRTRTVLESPGVVRHYVAGLDRRVQWNLSPPRVRIEEAVLDIAAQAPDDFAAIAELAGVVQGRRTTAPRIAAALGKRPRMARRSFLEGVLADIDAGTCSVLEHAYLHRVELAHGLPSAERQVVGAGGVLRDVDNEACALVVELDGRLFHDNAPARDRDLDRDLEAALDGRLTVRLGWGQVVGRPCVTSARVALLLRRRGWTGHPTPCPDCPDGVVPRIRATE